MQSIIGFMRSSTYLSGLKNSVIGMFFFLVFLINCNIAAGIVLVEQNNAKSVIVIPDVSKSVEIFAAQELQYHIAKATGAKLAIIQENAMPVDCKTGIFLGNCKTASQKGISTKGLKRNGFVIKCIDDNLFMAGRDGNGSWLSVDTETGTLFAVYQFLDEQMSVRWLWPGELGEVIPKRETIVVKDINVTSAPMLEQTRMRTGGILCSYQGWKSKESRDKFIHAQELWLKRHRFSYDCSFDARHSFTDYFKRFGGSHPEYFNLLPDGKRHADPYYINGYDGVISMCVSEPNLWKQIIQDWKVNTGTDGILLDISENDTSGKCICPRCLAWDVRDDKLIVPWGQRVKYATDAYNKGQADWSKYLGSLSDRYCRFALEVQKMARQVDPNIKVIIIPYANYLRAPINIKLNNHVLLAFTPGTMYPWTQAKVQQERHDFDGWLASGAKIFYRPNFMLDGHNMPIFFARKFAENFKYFCDRGGLLGSDYDSLTGQYGTQGMNLYIAARSNNCGRDNYEKLSQEYYSGFGSAKKIIQKYFEYLEKVSAKVDDETFSSISASVGPEGGTYASFYRGAEIVFTPQVMDSARQILDEAARQKDMDQTASERVAFLQKGLKNAQLTLNAEKAFKEFQKIGDKKSFVAAIAELDSYRASIENEYVANMAYLYIAEGRVWDRESIKFAVATGQSIDAGWKFMWDPNDEGISKEWFAEKYDESKWFDIGVYAPWEVQPVGKQWRQQHGRDYDGFGWYRNHFTISQADKPQQVVLVFGAVDEACKVWINGQLALTRPFYNLNAWDEMFEVDITQYVHFDQPNVLAVRVEDNAGAGGIWKGVKVSKK